MKLFYQLSIPSLQMMGPLQETKDLEPQKYFHFIETANWNPFLEIPESSEVKKLVFELHDRYPIPEGRVGIYRFAKIS